MSNTQDVSKTLREYDAVKVTTGDLIVTGVVQMPSSVVISTTDLTVRNVVAKDIECRDIISTRNAVVNVFTAESIECNGAAHVEGTLLQDLPLYGRAYDFRRSGAGWSLLLIQESLSRYWAMQLFNSFGIAFSADLAAPTMAIGAQDADTLALHDGTFGAYKDLRLRMLKVDGTDTPTGTTGDRTINKARGSVNIEAGSHAVTVTNNLVTATSHVIAYVMTADGNAYIKNVVVSAGSFVINLGANTAAETRVGFLVIN